MDGWWATCWPRARPRLSPRRNRRQVSPPRRLRLPKPGRGRPLDPQAPRSAPPQGQEAGRQARRRRRQVTPTGPGGRVVEDDVRTFAEGQAAAVSPTLPPGLPEPSKTVPLEGIRKSIADHMRGSMAGTAQLSFFLELDVTEAQRLRRDASGRGGGTIAMADVLIKACVETLRRHPSTTPCCLTAGCCTSMRSNIGWRWR